MQTNWPYLKCLTKIPNYSNYSNTVSYAVCLRLNTIYMYMCKCSVSGKWIRKLLSFFWKIGLCQIDLISTGVVFIIATVWYHSSLAKYYIYLLKEIKKAKTIDVLDDERAAINRALSEGTRNSILHRQLHRFSFF